MSKDLFHTLQKVALHTCNFYFHFLLYYLDDDKASGDYPEITETLSVAQDNFEPTVNLSPHPYSFKRPDGAEKRKGYGINQTKHDLILIAYFDVNF